MPAEPGQYELKAAPFRGYPEAEMGCDNVIGTFIRPSKSPSLCILGLKMRLVVCPGKVMHQMYFYSHKVIKLLEYCFYHLSVNGKCKV